MTNQIEEFRNQFVIGLVHWFILSDFCEGYFSKIRSLILILWSFVLIMFVYLCELRNKKFDQYNKNIVENLFKVENFELLSNFRAEFHHNLVISVSSI